MAFELTRCRHSDKCLSEALLGIPMTPAVATRYNQQNRGPRVIQCRVDSALREGPTHLGKRASRRSFPCWRMTSCHWCGAFRKAVSALWINTIRRTVDVLNYAFELEPLTTARSLSSPGSLNLGRPNTHRSLLFALLTSGWNGQSLFRSVTTRKLSANSVANIRQPCRLRSALWCASDTIVAGRVGTRAITAQFVSQAYWHAVHDPGQLTQPSFRTSKLTERRLVFKEYDSSVVRPIAGCTTLALRWIDRLIRVRCQLRWSLWIERPFRAGRTGRLPENRFVMRVHLRRT
jgi:hypothetical protein